MTTHPSANLAFQAEDKRGSTNAVPDTPLQGGGEAPAGRVERVMSIAPGPAGRPAIRRGSLLLASCVARAGVALIGVVAIWAGTAWALGWW